MNLSVGMRGILGRIARVKQEEVEKKRACRPLNELQRAVGAAPAPRRFSPDVWEGTGVNIIAELKRRAPSAGVLRDELDVRRWAHCYQVHGACAVSVLVDREFFGGSLEDVRAAREVTTIPVLAKEFIIDRYQLYEVREAGADAVLLIAALLGPERLGSLGRLSRELGLTPLVEIHRVEEAGYLEAMGTETLVGINNRDLETFSIDLETTRRLAPLVAGRWPVVCESGIGAPEDIAAMVECGVHVFLVGSALMRSDDPGSLLGRLSHGAD